MEQTAQKIVYWNRAEKREEVEKVYGDALVKLLYGGSRWGRRLTSMVTGPTLSKVVGAYQSSGVSRRRIRSFIDEFSIPMDEYESGPFRSFNDFFIRQFRPGARTIETDPGRMPAFAEARYLAFEKVTENQTFPVKGQHLTAEAVMGDAEKAAPFVGGACLLARLCPVDYHRFHYPDDGKTLDCYRVPGALHSVNPAALRYKSEILCSNERQVCILETKHFGKIAYVEVGALCVGKIVQTHSHDLPFSRGDEKGYFLFGASTVIVFGEPGKWVPDSDLLEQTRRDRESLVRLGESVATRSRQ